MMAVTLALSACSGMDGNRRRPPRLAPPPPRCSSAHQAAVDAYIYGYPLVTMEMTRRVMTNVATPDGKHGPDGPVRQAARLSDAALQEVTAPNADTLYTTAWLDVAKEPRS